MQFNAHVEIVDGVERWWAEISTPEGTSGVYVAADSWDELWRLAHEIAVEQFGETSIVLVRPEPPETPAA